MGICCNGLNGEKLLEGFMKKKCRRTLYNNAIEEIISDTSKFEKLNEDPTLKHETSLQRFLRTLKQKKLF